MNQIEPPLTGANLDDAVKWLREPPSRLEIYRVVGLVATVTSKLIQGSMSIVREDPVKAVEQLQEAISELSKTLSLMPQMEQDVIDAFESLRREQEDG